MDDASESLPQKDAYPVADVQTTRTPAEVGGVIVSRLWFVTGLCLLAAAGLVAAQLRSGGPHVDVNFTEGHGLQAGDAVRYRGIDVGQVKEIALSPDLDGVLVRIQLTEAAAPLAREGTRFWIERPDISVGQVRGLDTLVGGRYVGVLPGPVDAPASQLFYGMDVASAPIDDIADGLEIMLEGNHRLGLQNGSPISYRGVTVGHVLSVGLANDAVTVEARGFIEPKYRQLVRVNSRFWSNSGLDLKIGFSGLELDAETLSTIASGGVALATPNSPGRPAATGHRFELYESPRDEWIQWQPRVAIGSAALPPGVPVPRPLPGIRRSQSALAVLGSGRQRGWVLPLEGGRLLGPANVLTKADDNDGDYVVEVSGQQFALPLAELVAVRPLAVTGLLPGKLDEDVATWPVELLRRPKAIEEVVVTCGTDELTMPLSTQRLTPSEGIWQVDGNVPLDDGWHGACVVAARDGFVIGVLIRSDDHSLIVPLADELLDAVPGPPQ